MLDILKDEKENLKGELYITRSWSQEKREY